MLQHIAYFVTAIILFLLLAFTPMDNEQAADTAIIKGTVVCAETEKPVAEAQVRITDTELSAVTNEEGTFELAGLEKTAYQLIVSAEGYAEQVQDIAIDEEEYSIKIALQSKSETDAKEDQESDS